MSDRLSGPGVELALALATWIYILHSADVHASDELIETHCRAVDAAEDSEAGDAAGMKLVRRVMALVGPGEPEVATVLTVLRELYGESLYSDMGHGDRDARAARIQQRQFAGGLPWLARIIERKASGEVGPVWLLVERVSDVVQVMDPNPWDDIDEERFIPWCDFAVLWELDDCTSAAVVRGSPVAPLD